MGFLDSFDFSTPDYSSFSYDGGGFSDPPLYDFGLDSGQIPFDTTGLSGFEDSTGQFRQMPGSAPPAAPAPQGPPQALSPLLGGLFGALGPLAGLIGGLTSGGQTGSQTRQLPFQGRVAGTQASGALGQLGQFGAGNTPLQQMQMSLLQALQSGQGLPPGYQRLIEQAYQPQMGDLYTQAANQGRARGFFDAPATSPPGGAILGPGLAALQGQMAGSKLGLMQSLPGLFNQPIQTQANAAGQTAGGFSNLMGNYGGFGGTQTQQVPLGQMLGQGAGNIMAGIYGGINSANQADSQRQFAQFLSQMMQQQAPQGGMSFAQYPTG